MEWFYAVNDERRGPIADSEMEVLVANGTIRPSTLVWRQGMADWAPFSSMSGGAANYSGDIGMRYAGFWIRFAAKIIDIIILNVIGFIMGFAVGLLSALALGEEAELALTIAIYAAALVLNVLYYTLFVGAYGATPGKMALSLQVVRADGSPVSYLLAFGRYVAAALNYFTLLIGWFMVGWNEEKRGLHDYICDTRVIRAD